MRAMPISRQQLTFVGNSAVPAQMPDTHLQGATTYVALKRPKLLLAGMALLQPACGSSANVLVRICTEPEIADARAYSSYRMNSGHRATD